MSFVRTSGGNQAFRGIAFRDGAGVLQNAKTLSVRTATALRTVFSTLAVSISPSFLSASSSSPTFAYPTTSPASAVITGGTAPFTYAWSSDGDFDPTTPTLPTCRFGCSTGLGPGDAADGYAYLTITDANGTMATAAPIYLNAFNSHIF